jgi:hypothetical protein
LNKHAAKAAQTNGATINTQTRPKAQSWNKAGPKLLAGFTDVQVSHNPSK